MDDSQLFLNLEGWDYGKTAMEMKMAVNDLLMTTALLKDLVTDYVSPPLKCLKDGMAIMKARVPEREDDLTVLLKKVEANMTQLDILINAVNDSSTLANGLVHAMADDLNLFGKS